MMFNLKAGTYSKTYACDLVNMEVRTNVGLSPFGWRCLSTIVAPPAEGGNESLPAVRTEVYPDPSFTISNP
jgi:hypothetical protein